MIKFKKLCFFLEKNSYIIDIYKKWCYNINTQICKLFQQKGNKNV